MTATLQPSKKDAPVSVQPVRLKPETMAAFDAYVLAAEKAMDESGQASAAFLWSEGDAERVQQIRKGAVVAEYWGAKMKDPVAVPDGLIHDLIGAVFVPERSLQQAVALVQDYENHKNIYKPEVIDSKVVSRAGEEFQIHLRLLKKKVITVVLDTYHDAHYLWQGAQPRVVPLAQHANSRGETCRHSERIEIAARRGLRISVATVLVLALRAERRRSIH